MDNNIDDKDSIVNKLRQTEDENEKLKQQLLRLNNLYQQLQRDNHRMHSVLNHIHGMSGAANDSQNSSGLVVADSAGQLNASNTAHQHTLGGATNDETSLNQKSECEPLNFDERTWCEERKRELKCIKDERRLRHYLCQAISRNARKFAMELDVLHLLDQLVSHVCITEDEYKDMRSLVDSTNLARVLLPLVLRRDCRTLLSFIDILFECDKHLTKFITQEYDNLVQKENCCSDVTGTECSHCLLVQRVEPILIIDFLISHDYSKWLPFYEQVVNCKDDVPERRKAWWDNFMVHVNDDRTSAEMTSTIIEALEACGFHSDVVENLRDDQNNNVNCFICKLTHRFGENQTSGQGAEEVHAYEPRMQVLKEVDENTNLKMIQDTMKSSTTEELEMQVLKLFDSESGARTEGPDETRQGQDENTNTTGHNYSENGPISILFISNSDITITNKNS